VAAVGIEAARFGQKKIVGAFHPHDPGPLVSFQRCVALVQNSRIRTAAIAVMKLAAAAIQAVIIGRFKSMYVSLMAFSPQGGESSPGKFRVPWECKNPLL